MKYAYLNNIPSSSSAIDAFGGYNHTANVNNNEMYEMKNLSSDSYPYISPRKTRGIYLPNDANQHHYNGIIAKDAICYVDGTNFYINQNLVISGLTDNEKTLVSMGGYVIIFPDKVWVNTIKQDNEYKYGNLEHTFSDDVNVQFSLCNADAEEYIYTHSTEAPANPQNMQYWVDTSVIPNVLKQYSAQSSTWVEIPTTYIKMSATNIASEFKEGDGVRLSGITLPEVKELNNKYSIIQKAYHNENGNGDYLVFIGLITQTVTQASGITVSRDIPAMDYVIESGNRLWGCRYGLNNNGDVVNEIYASKLGDFKNWNCFGGISTDSYAASCGTDGVFTGAVNYLGYPLFFKENVLHKVYGNFPANYQVQTTTMPGVKKGSHKSLSIVNSTLFYESTNGVMAYTGSLPSKVSTALGNEIYSNGVGGAFKNKYYYSTKNSLDVFNLFVFDTSLGLWHKEDNTEVKAFCENDNNLYYISDNKIKTIHGSDEASVNWECETGVITSPNITGGRITEIKKYISKIAIRLSMESGSWIKIYLQYDSNGIWQEVYFKQNTSPDTDNKVFTAYIIPKRCDNIKLKFEGEGNAMIQYLTQTFEKGSDK